jgi:hypothetical protein
MSAEETTDSCCNCSNELSGKETAQLYPCNHKICLPCLCRDLAKKEHTRRMICANCKCEVTKHRVCLINGTTEKAVKHKEPIIKDIYKDPSDAKDPYRYWCKKYPNEEERKGRGILYIAIEEDISIGKFFICDTIEISDDLVIGSDIIRNTLVELARRFHSTLFPKPTRPIDSNLSLSISDLANEAIECTHPTFLFLYSLATGDTLISNLRDQSRNMKTGSVSEPKKDLLAIFSAFQLLQSLYANQNANNKQNTRSQLAIGSLLYDLQVEQKIIQALSQFRIVPGITTLKNRAMDFANTNFDDIPLPNANDFPVLCADNLVMEKKGRKDHIDQWTIHTIKLVRESELNELNLYEINQSRDMKTIDQLIIESEEKGLTLAEHTVKENDGDLRLLSHRKLLHIEAMIRLSLPSHDQCSGMIDSGYYTWENGIPRNLGVDVHPQVKYDTDNKRVPFKTRKYVSNMEESDRITLNQDGKSMLEKNDMFVDAPLREDLAKIEVVKQYLEMMLRMQKEMVEKSSDQSNIRPIIENVMFFIGDGSPIFTSHTIFDDDKASGANRYKDIRVFPGGFHMMKELVTKKSSIVSEVTRYYIGDFRGTEGSQKFVMDPYDPRQFEDEAIPTIAAHYRSAAEHYAASVKRDDIDSREVYNAMRERAVKYPPAKMAFDELLLLEAYFLLRDAERSDCADLFFTAVRIILPLFCTTNAYKYIRICVELLIWKKAASPWEIKLFEEFAFTRETEGGKRIYVDLAQEKVNKSFRSIVGTRTFAGITKKMFTAAMNINSFLAKKKDNDILRGTKRTYTGPFNESESIDWEVYAKIRVAIENTNLWRFGHPVLVGADDMFPANTDAVQAPDGSPLSNDTMKYRSLGARRRDKIIEVFYLEPNHRHSTNRTQSYTAGGVPVSTGCYTKKDYKKEIDRRSVLALSVEKVSLKKMADNKKLPILTEIINTLDLLQGLGINLTEDRFNREGLNNRMQRTSVMEHLNILVELRKKYKKEFVNRGNDWDGERLRIKEEIKKSISETSEEERRLELNEKCYVIHPDFHNRERYYICHSNL